MLNNLWLASNDGSLNNGFERIRNVGNGYPEGC